jgi:hypothetical protein
MDAITPPRDERDASAYEAPKIIDYGSLTEITAGMGDGGLTDRAFPAGTPKRDLTFS